MRKVLTVQINNYKISNNIRYILKISLIERDCRWVYKNTKEYLLGQIWRLFLPKESNKYVKAKIVNSFFISSRLNVGWAETKEIYGADQNRSTVYRGL